MMAYLLFMLAMVLILVWYFFSQLKNKCKVLYTRATGQEIEKMVPSTGRHLIFDGKKFDILPDRHRITWKSFFGIVGTWVLTYHLVWYSRYPLDPKQYGINTVSPEANHDMNTEAQFHAYQKAERERYKDKKGGGGGMFDMILKFMPVVALLAAVVAIYMVEKNNTNLTIVEKTLQQILTQQK
jgi:hypothetical protein